ncbi:MAG: hypothetical protein KC736_03895 [Candidatus Moranbacteria bacterium]|nr:hypothetical protein [Candidatus Moranbacteria bacterium]
MKQLIHFGADQVFEGQATTYTCIVITQNGKSDTFIFDKVRDLTRWKNESTKTEIINLPTEVLSEAPWVFPSKREQEIISQIEKTCRGKLIDIAEIFVGLQTSADSIFFLNPEKEDDKHVYFSDTEGGAQMIEKEVLRAAILDKAVSPFQYIIQNKKLIFPYEQKNGRNVLMSEENLKMRYPHAYKYLLQYKQKLQARKMPNAEERWYQFGRSQSLNKFNTQKLIIKNPALQACATFDDQDILFTGGGNGPYYGVRPKNNTEVLYLLALLNHPIFDKWVKLRSSVFRGGYYSFGRQFIADFPVKISETENDDTTIKKIVEYWGKIVQLNKVTSTTPNQNAEILRQKTFLKFEADRLLSGIYGVYHEELISVNDEENGDE